MKLRWIAAALAAAGCASGPPPNCSDYLSTQNCLGQKRDRHQGIDFRGVQGTEVISATHGTVVRMAYGECPGESVVVRTDITAVHEGVQGPVFAHYIHAAALDGVKIGQRVRPGDPIARIIPLRRTACYGSTEHVHYELRVRDSPRRHIDPHQFWVAGFRRVTCFRPGMEVPAGKTVAPLRCSR